LSPEIVAFQGGVDAGASSFPRSVSILRRQPWRTPGERLLVRGFLDQVLLLVARLLDSTLVEDLAQVALGGIALRAGTTGHDRTSRDRTESDDARFDAKHVWFSIAV